jgi:holo-[acyl-carrier protein] synthase
MIFGIGMDLVHIDRIAGLHARFGNRFENRIFTDCERSYCLSQPCPHLHLAARFAAKEAFFKALGTGKLPTLRWREVSVERSEAGRPIIQVSGSLTTLLMRLEIRNIHVTITHTNGTAAAVVVLEH